METAGHASLIVLVLFVVIETLAEDEKEKEKEDIWLRL